MSENFTVGWGTLALINAAIAQTKSRSAAYWLLYSLFLGPIATALLVLLPKYEPTPEGVERERKLEKMSTVTLRVFVVVLLAVIIGLFAKAWLF